MPDSTLSLCIKAKNYICVTKKCVTVGTAQNLNVQWPGMKNFFLPCLFGWIPWRLKLVFPTQAAIKPLDNDLHVICLTVVILTLSGLPTGVSAGNVGVKYFWTLCISEGQETGAIVPAPVKKFEGSGRSRP
jgi:hypothetical protein